MDPIAELREYLAERTQIGPCCHLWTGPRSQKRAHDLSVIVRAYSSKAADGSSHSKPTARVVVELARGYPLGPGEQALHRCDVPLCVRLDHLYVGTAKDNSRDAVDRGRARPAGRTRAARVAPFEHDPACGHDHLERLVRTPSLVSHPPRLSPTPPPPYAQESMPEWERDVRAKLDRYAHDPQHLRNSLT